MWARFEKNFAHIHLFSKQAKYKYPILDSKIQQAMIEQYNVFVNKLVSMRLN